MKQIITALLIIVSLSGCGIRRYFTYTHWKGDVENYNTTKIELDNNYVLFTRQIGKAKSDFAVDRDNYEAIAGTDKEKIEVEYLLYSPVSKRILYLTTIPPFYTGDNDHRFIYDEPLFNNSNYVNIWFLNLFYIGYVDETEHSFTFTRKDKNITDTWHYSLNGDQSILTVDQLTDNENSELQHFKAARPDTTFSYSFKFYKQKDFHLGINGHWHDAEFREGVELTGDLKTLYYANTGKRTDIFFNIGKEDTTSAQDDWVHFGNARSKYKP